MRLPNVPIPAPVRMALLKKAIWDTLRTRLSYDQAKAVQAQAEAAVAIVIEDAIQQGVGL